MLFISAAASWWVVDTVTNNIKAESQVFSSTHIFITSSLVLIEYCLASEQRHILAITFASQSLPACQNILSQQQVCLIRWRGVPDSSHSHSAMQPPKTMAARRKQAATKNTRAFRRVRNRHRACT